MAQDFYDSFYKLIKEKGITIVSKECYEPSMGRDEHLYLKDDNGFLNEDGTYNDKPMWGTIDLSGNGFCFREEFMEDRYKLIEEFYAVKDFGWFKEKIEELKEEE